VRGVLCPGHVGHASGDRVGHPELEEPALESGQSRRQSVGRKCLGVRRAIRFEQLAFGERAAVDRVEPEPVDQMHHAPHREPVVADRGHRDAVRRPRIAWIVVELVVAELIQALYDPGAGEMCLLPLSRDLRRRCRANSSSRRRESCRRTDRWAVDGTGGPVQRERSHRRSRRPSRPSTRRHRGRARRPTARSVRPGQSLPRQPRSRRPAWRVRAPSQASRPRRSPLAPWPPPRWEQRLEQSRSSARRASRSPRLIQDSSRYLAIGAGEWVERTGLATSPGAAALARTSGSPGYALSSSRTRGETSRPSSSIDPLRCPAGTGPTA
jgi:hypothetical protein